MNLGHSDFDIASDFGIRISDFKIVVFCPPPSVFRLLYSVLCWNRKEKKWFMFYTNRRANVPDTVGVSWVHDTPIGIAESSDLGATWKYRTTAKIGYEKGEDTYEQRRSSIQVVELEFKDGWLTCDRDKPTHILLQPPANARTD